MCFTGAVHDPDRLESEVLETFQPVQPRDLGVEASTAKLPMAAVDPAMGEDVVAGGELATPLAPDWLCVHHHLTCPRWVFPLDLGRATNAMQFTRFQIASMTYLSDSSGTLCAIQFEVSTVT